MNFIHDHFDGDPHALDNIAAGPPAPKPKTGIERLREIAARADLSSKIKGKGALQWLDELDREPPRFTVDSIIPVDCLIAIFGQPKHGKSFVAIDLSFCVGTGTPYHGRAVEKGFVVYVAGEGKRGTIARFDALAVHHGAPLDGIALRSGIPLNQEGSAEHIIAEVRAAMAERGLGNPAMIVIDTLKRNFAGDQNASKDMSIFVKSCDTIREAFPDSSVVVVNHSTHAEKDRMGGSIDLLAALDAEYKVEKKDGRVVVTNTNMKDAEEVEPFAFDFKGYDLSHGRNAPVLIPADLPQKAKPVGKNEALAIEAYNEAVKLHEGFGAKLDDVRRIFYERHGSDNESTKRCAFHREHAKLFEESSDGVVTIPGKITDDDFDIG